MDAIVGKLKAQRGDTQRQSAGDDDTVVATGQAANPPPSAANADSGTAQSASGARATTASNAAVVTASQGSTADASPADAATANGAGTTTVPSDFSQPETLILATHGRWQDAKDDAGDDASTPAANVTAASQSQMATNTAQLPANPAQVIAAAVVVEPQMNAQPETNNGGALAIGAPASGHAKPAIAMAIAGDQAGVPGAGATTDGAATKPKLSGTDNTNTAASGSSGGDAQIQPSNRNFTEQAETQTAGDTALPEQTDGPASAADHATGGAPAPLTISSAGTDSSASNAPSGTGLAKVDATGLPNFGFSASSATASSTTEVAAALTTSGTSLATATPIAGLAVVIAARAKAGSNQFDIRLDPPELGRIDVRLDVNGNGQVTTHVTADRADTLQLLQSQQPQLERALDQAGLKTADNGLQFTLRDHSFAGQQNGSNSQPSSAAQLVIPDANLTPVAASQIYTRGGLGSGVDIRV